jgi:hypothetical protein
MTTMAFVIPTAERHRAQERMDHLKQLEPEELPSR